MTTSVSGAPDARPAIAGAASPGAAARATTASRVFRRPLVMAVCGAVICAAAFPPLDFGPLILVGSALIVAPWSTARPWRAAAYGATSALVFFALVCAWMRYFGVIAMIPLFALLACYWAAAGALVAWLESRGLGHPALTAAIWVTFEAWRGRWPFGGFTWGEAGYAWHDTRGVVDLAAWGGVRLLTFLTIWLGATLARWLFGASVAGRVRGAVPVATTVGSCGLLAIVGVLALPSQPLVGSLRVASVQGNDINRDLTIDELDARYLPANHFRLAETIAAPVDIVIFPESSMDADPRRESFVRTGVIETARRLETNVIANYSNVPRPDGRVENTNFFYSRRGEFVGRYVKKHLVPFGEYLPLRRYLGWIGATAAIGRDKAPGQGSGLFEFDGHTLATMICYESAFGEIARSDVRGGASLLIVTTNNRSYRRSANSDQHIAMSQLRAIETGRDLVHSGISGKTAFIDHRGRVRVQTKLFEPTVARHTVMLRRGRTPYVVLGDWPVYGSMAATAIAGMCGLRRARRARPARRRRAHQPSISTLAR